MAAPVADKIQLPVDTGNLGKKVRTQTRVVGSDTVHEHFWVQGRRAEILGVYRHALTQQTVQAAAQNGTSTGFLWAHIPSAVSNKTVRLRRAVVESQHSSALATPTAPRVVLVRFSFTGTASGASANAVAKVNDAAPTPVFDLRTAVTGLTPTLGAVLGSAGLAGALTAVGAYAPVGIDLVNAMESEDEWPLITPGNGVVLYQDVAGTASDTRKFNLQLVWDEIDTA